MDIRKRWKKYFFDGSWRKTNSFLNWTTQKLDMYRIAAFLLKNIGKELGFYTVTKVQNIGFYIKIKYKQETWTFSLTSSAKPHRTTPFLTNSRATPPHKLLSKTKSGGFRPKRPRRTCLTSGWNGLGVRSGSISNFWSKTGKCSRFRLSRKRRQNLSSSSPKVSGPKINSNAGAITRRCSTSMGTLLVSSLSWLSVSASPPRPMKKLNLN